MNTTFYEAEIVYVLVTFSHNIDHTNLGPPNSIFHVRSLRHYWDNGYKIIFLIRKFTDGFYLFSPGSFVEKECNKQHFQTQSLHGQGHDKLGIRLDCRD